MKKLLTIVCLSGLLSVPSVVFAEASWYGSLRGAIGSNADGQTGIADGSSRFGVKGSSEVSEGLTAIYNFEHSFGPTGNLVDGGGRHHYVGLSGGFGTLTIGQSNSASSNNIAVITDNAYFLGAGSGVTSRTAGVKYSVSVENISIQADVVMNQGDGLSQTPVDAAAAVKEDKNVDQVEIGASMGLGENGKIAFAHISHDSNLKTKKSQNYVAGQYTIGGMTGYLGLSQTKSSDDTLVGTEVADSLPGLDRADDMLLKYKRSTKRVSGTYAGIRGSVGDTGLSYVFQVVKLKTKSTNAGTPYAPETGSGDDLVAAVPGIQGGAANAQTSSTPWVLSLSRSLGGGATVVFEHTNPDDNTKKSSSILALIIGF